MRLLPGQIQEFLKGGGGGGGGGGGAGGNLYPKGGSRPSAPSCLCLHIVCLRFICMYSMCHAGGMKL